MNRRPLTSEATALPTQTSLPFANILTIKNRFFKISFSRFRNIYILWTHVRQHRPHALSLSLSLSLSLPHSLPSSLFSFFLSPFLSFSVLLNLSLSLFYSFFISFSLSLFLYLILHICTYPLKLFVVLWPSVFSIPSILVLQFNPTNWATIVMAELKNISSSFLCLWSLVLCLYTFYDFLADYCSFLFPSG